LSKLIVGNLGLGRAELFHFIEKFEIATIKLGYNKLSVNKEIFRNKRECLFSKAIT
jgi:hypothetical protein